MISGKRVLCAAAPHLGHAIPTAALALKFQHAGNEVFVITDSGKLADFYQRAGLSCIDLPSRDGSIRQNAAMMLQVLQEVKPDISICDWRRDYWLAQRLVPPPCQISILRSENFFGYQRQSPFMPILQHVAGVDPEENRLLREFNRAPISDPRQLFQTNVIVIPSLPEFDPLSNETRKIYESSEIIYTGPLYSEYFDAAPCHLREWAESERRCGRPVVLVTTGTCWGRDFCLSLMRSMHRAQFSAILAIPKQKTRMEIERHAQPHLFIVEGAQLSALLPECDVVIHHCGHGTFQSVVLAGKPSITIPSYEYDREESALRLQELKCSIHLTDSLYRYGLQIEQLNETIGRMLNDQEIAAATQRMSNTIRSFMAQRGTSYVLKVLEQKHLIPAGSRHTAGAGMKRKYSLPKFPMSRIRMTALCRQLNGKIGAFRGETVSS